MDAKVTVAKMDGTLRVIVVLPPALDALSAVEQGRVIEAAMWKAAEAAGSFLHREAVEGRQRAVTTELAVA